jgi:hypothetical protein
MENIRVGSVNPNPQNPRKAKKDVDLLFKKLILLRATWIGSMGVQGKGD